MYDFTWFVKYSEVTYKKLWFDKKPWIMLMKKQIDILINQKLQNLLWLKKGSINHVWSVNWTKDKNTPTKITSSETMSECIRNNILWRKLGSYGQTISTKSKYPIRRYRICTQVTCKSCATTVSKISKLTTFYHNYF